MFARLLRTEQLQASKTLAGAVYEHEKENTKTNSVIGNLKNTTGTIIRTVDRLRGKFLIFLILLFCSLYKTNRFYFNFLPSVCSIGDHRRRQNVVKTSVAHSPVAHTCVTFCSYHILM